MPSSQRQKGVIIKSTNKKTGKTQYIVIANRTGFMDVNIRGKRFYYNSSEKNVDLSKVDINKIIDDYETQEQKKKGIIVIRRR